LVLIHHFIFFMMEYFSFSHILLVLKDTLFHGIFTLVILGIFNLFLGNQKRG